MAGDDTRRKGIVRSLYAAYIEGRKDDAGAMLTEDFSFSSPRDDRIDRIEYFSRCWPEPPPFRDMEIEYLQIAGDEAVVRYRAEKHDGGAFRNMEVLRFRGDKVASVDVFFGRNV
ncbi:MULTISPECIES: nuclear transport factor 2 family protein [unclassified Rhizobium]|uniref:nuclear transport factor 2 family protein n=1 Tax=unclassified Rhizobium TaxID=2613769 RepID=UPI00161B34E0|nr:MULTISPECIES: nuclear transport factor 2 family protein [unclassified Rhizobium]MBB3539856.1 ketosteroid isomerase-like protein [Rhizobium sp. BK399]MCS3739135.1 ketosteroid isomerase-like protein [Rhizobium sp. BK661]MCS4090541.1 ketosteroid isomerase-like protein [Rhizobium sp. BK176]